MSTRLRRNSRSRASPPAETPAHLPPVRPASCAPQACASVPRGPAGLLRFVADDPHVPVAAETLGGFRLLREGRPVELVEWQSKKARDLLKLLVTRQGRPVPRERLMEALWPGEDVAKLPNRLSVALSTLRSVLDPEHTFPPDRYVRTVTDAVWLENVDVDVSAFLDDAEAGLDAHDALRLEKAEALYVGEFLDEDLYQDWTAPLREEARAAYIRVTRTLSEMADAEGRYDAAASYVRRILEHDAYDERAHITLARTLQATGQHGEARRAYQTYVRRMEEIGVEASPYPTRDRSA